MAITYELKFALENIPDPDLPPNAGVVLPSITHVVFKQDILYADDMLEMIEAGESFSALTTSEGMAKAARALLPRITNLTESHCRYLAARDFMHLIGLMSPFFEF